LFICIKRSDVLTVSPKWVIEPKDIRITAGNELSLECRADGEPKPVIKWIDSKGCVYKVFLKFIFF
jgi:hypothetical protein